MPIKGRLTHIVAAGCGALSFILPASSQCLGLEDAMGLSAHRAPSVLIALAEEEAAEASVMEAKSLFRPRVSAFGRTGAGDLSAVDSVVSNQFGVQVSQRIYDFGQAKFTRRSAELISRASREDTRNVRVNTARDTGLYYLQRLQAIEEIEFTQRRRNYFANQLKIMDELLPEGGATRSERANIAARLAEAEGYELDLLFVRERAEARLESRTGVTVNFCADLDETTPQFVGPELIDQALDRNPGLRALEYRAEGLEADRKRQKRSRWPAIDVVATGAYSSYNTGLGNDDDFRFTDRIGVDVSVPLYSGNAIRATNQRAAARQAAAEAEVLEAKRELAESLSILLRGIESLRARLAAFEEAEAQNRIRFETAEDERVEGLRTLSSLIEIRLEYEEAGLQRIQAKYELERQKLQLRALADQLIAEDEISPTFDGPLRIDVSQKD